MNQLLASFLIGAIAFWGAFQLYPKIFQEAADEIAVLSLEDTIRHIELELAEIAATPGDTAGLILDTVKVELSAQRQDEENTTAELAVPVFDEASIGVDTTRKLTRGSKITVAFKAPAGDELLADGAHGELDLSALVLAARQALLATAKDDPVLLPKSVDIEVHFVLARIVKGEGKIKAYVIAVGGSSSQLDTGGNKIVLGYVNPLFAEEKKDSAGKAVPPI